MRRLNRYIGRTVFVSSLGALLVLVGINSLSQVIVEIGNVDDNYSMSTALLVTALKMPSAISEFLSYGIFLGCIIGLGLHANSNELSVIRAAGVSVYRILWAVMRPTLVLILIGLFLSEYVNPVSNELVRSLQGGENPQRAVEAPYGTWYKDVERGEFLHFNRVETGGRIFGVSRYRYDDQGKLLSAGYAEQAIYQENGFWQLENYKQSNLVGDRIELSPSPERIWRTALSPQLLNILVIPPESLSIKDLYQFANYRDQQNLQSHEYWLWLWQRVLQPVTVLSLVLLGMSFIFGSLREVTMGSRIALAVIVGFFVRVNISMLGTASTVIGFSPLLAVLVPALLCGAVGMFLLARR